MTLLRDNRDATGHAVVERQNGTIFDAASQVSYASMEAYLTANPQYALRPEPQARSIPRASLEGVFSTSPSSPQRARALAEAGLATIAAVAVADVTITDARIQELYGSTIEVATQYATQGVGPMAQATWNHLTEQLAREPGFQSPPGSGNVNWAQVMDYAMGMMSELFVGEAEVMHGLRTTGSQGPLTAVLERLPAPDPSHFPDLAHTATTTDEAGVTRGDEAGSPALWRASLNPAGTGIRPEFDDGSGGQMRHTWVYVAIGYNTASGGAQPSLTNTMGNWVHESIEPGGTRQDFFAGQAGWIYGSTLWGAREGAAQGDQTAGRNAAANSGMSISGFFSGQFAPQMNVTYPSPDGPVTVEPDVRWSTGSGSSGSAVAMAALERTMRNSITRNMVDNLPWAGTGRENDTMLVIQGYYPRE